LEYPPLSPPSSGFSRAPWRVYATLRRWFQVREDWEREQEQAQAPQARAPECEISSSCARESLSETGFTSDGGRDGLVERISIFNGTSPQAMIRYLSQEYMVPTPRETSAHGYGWQWASLASADGRRMARCDVAPSVGWFMDRRGSVRAGTRGLKFKSVSLASSRSHSVHSIERACSIVGTSRV
jgi:hypothetical protein